VLTGSKVLVTGVTGRVGRPIAEALATTNEVWGIARFRDEALKRRLQDATIRCERVDLTDADFSTLPDDFDYVLHFGAAMEPSSDFDRDLRVDAEATGLLMTHCRTAKAFLHCSSGLVYRPNGHVPHVETDPLGDHSGRGRPTYSICNIAGEAVARTGARQFGLPTIVTRLNVPYGDNGIWPGVHLELIQTGKPVPVHPGAPSLFSPIHLDDMVAMLPGLLNGASVPAVVVNWAGPQQVSVQEWAAFMGELVGRPVSFEDNELMPQSIVLDVTKLASLGCRTTIDWRDGFRRMVAALHPELGL
jgi:nucleoside-diphosphate-sugar epimerase